jgi:hypothetical protein
MENFGTATINTDSSEPVGKVVQTEKGFIQQFIVRDETGARLVSVFARKIDTYSQVEIPIRFKTDLVFADEN